MLEDDFDRVVTFYDFPEAHWKHLRTTNVVESPFASVRLRTTAAKRFKRVESATALIWKLLTVAEKRFRRLDAPHLLSDVFEGTKFEDGKPLTCLYLSQYFKQHRSDYYDLLSHVRRTGDWEAWLDFFLKRVKHTAEDAVSTAQRLAEMFRDRAQQANFLPASENAIPCPRARGWRYLVDRSEVGVAERSNARSGRPLI